MTKRVDQVDDALGQRVAIVEEERDLGHALLFQRHEVALVLRLGEAAEALFDQLVAVGVDGADADRTRLLNRHAIGAKYTIQKRHWSVPSRHTRRVG